MYSSTIDYRQRAQCFPQDLNRLLPFNSSDYFTIHCETIQIQFLCISDFWSISGLLFIPHWWGFFIGRRSGWNVWKSILSDLELPVLLSMHRSLLSVSCQNIDYNNRTKLSGGPMGKWFVTLKVYEGPLSYAEGSSLTLHNHFIQP